MGKTSQLQLLLGQVEVPARDLSVALAVWRDQREKTRGKKRPTHMDLVRLDLVARRHHRRGLFSIYHDATTMLLDILSTLASRSWHKDQEREKQDAVPQKRARVSLSCRKEYACAMMRGRNRF